MRVAFILNEQIRKLLGGRRLQFRIRDKERGDSDWYTIKQTFVRTPNIVSLKCSDEMNNQCEMKGEGLDYIQQVSVDEGKSWFPEEAAGLVVQPVGENQKIAMIPPLADKRMLQIRLRDFPKTDGLPVSGYNFSNSVKITKKTAGTNKTKSTSEPTDQTK